MSFKTSLLEVLNMNVLRNFKFVLLTLVIFSYGCGGGGGSSSPAATENNASDNTEAQEPAVGEETLDTEAVNGADNPDSDNLIVTSSSMEVDETFKFSSERSVELQITATGPLGYPLDNKTISIYTTKIETTADSEQIPFPHERFYEGTTDVNGKLTVKLLLANHITNLNVQISAMGIENSKFITTDESLINVSFF